MSRFANILAVVQSRADALPVLTRATALQSQDEGPANLHVLRVVHEGIADLPARHIDASTELKQFVLSAEESALEDDLAATGIHLEHAESATIWNRRTWEGIAHTAEAVNADLIVKVSGTTGAAVASLRTPDDWNLLRNVSTPVLMTHGGPWMKTPAILAAIDTFDVEHEALNERILETAAAFAQRTGAVLHIVSVYPPLGRWSAQLELLKSYDRLKADVEKDIYTEINRLTASLGLERFKVHAIEGRAEAVIQGVLDDIGGYLLVLGTKARTGVGGLLLGNTSERLLSLLKGDVLTVS